MKDSTVNSIGDFVVWGKQILQQEPMAMDRVCLRRLCFYLEKNVRKIVREAFFIDTPFCEVLDVAIPNIEQFLEDCLLRKAFVYFTMGTFRTEHNCEINIKFKQDHPKSEEITLAFKIDSKIYCNLL